MRQIELWNEFENHLLNQGVTQKRVHKLKSMFSIAEREFDKDFTKATRKHIERFVTALHRNTFKKVDGTNFSGSTKSDLKKFLKQFYKWLKGDNEFYPKEVSWIKSRISKDELPTERPVLNINEVNILANSFNKIEFRLLVLLLFDSGFRIQEMLSVKKKDIAWEEYDENQKCFWINCNESKTEKRKIPVPLFTEDLKAFCNSSYYQSLKDDELVFNISYPYFLRQLKDNSERLLKVKISPHALRHSSATHYAREYDGNMNLLAERYGWSYSSKELRTYIRRSGAYQKAGAKKVFTNEVMRIREENETLKDKIKTIEERQEADLVVKEFIEKLTKSKEGVAIASKIARENPKLFEDMVKVFGK